MSINAETLSQHVLGEIFSYLSPKDLGRVAQVCRSWNASLKLDWIWQNVAQSILDLPEPTNGSWKEQCQILHRWKTLKAQEVSFSYRSGSQDARSLMRLDKNEFAVLLDDNTAIEVVRPDPSRSSLFSVRNLFSHEEFCQIDMEQYGFVGTYMQLAVYNDVLTARDKNGTIFQFDVTTGACINQFDGGLARTGQIGVIHSNGHEIIECDLNRVQIWDLQQPGICQTFEIEEGQEIFQVRSTPNFVVCIAYQAPLQALSPCSIFAVNKKDPTIQTRISLEEGSPMNVLGRDYLSYGANFTFLRQNGTELHIYEDTPDAQFQLVKVVHIRGNPRYESTMRMYRNWVCVYNDGAFRIYDVRNGRKISSIKIDWGDYCTFKLGAQGMLVSSMFYDEHNRRDTFYDFSGKVQQLPSSRWCTVM